MKICLVNAPSYFSGKNDPLGASMFPPLGLLSLGSFLRENGHEINLIDGGIAYSEKKFYGSVLDQDADVYLISSMTNTVDNAYTLTEKIEDSKVILGGPHVTALPSEAMERSSADFIVLGEGEPVILRLLESIDKDRGFAQVPNIGYSGKLTERKCFNEDIDKYPIPAFDLIDYDKYSGYMLKKASPEANIAPQRGCPYSCTFCSNPVWSGIQARLHSVPRVLEEMDYLVNEKGIKEIFSLTENIAMSKKWALNLCDKKDPDLPWKAQLRPDSVTDSIAKALYDSGCWYVHLGIESAHDKTLNGIGKGYTTQQVLDAAKKLKKYDIKVAGLFMLFNVWEDDGLKYEGFNESMQTIEFSKAMMENGLIDYANLSMTTPLPGSKLFDIALKNKMIDYPRSWKEWYIGGPEVMKIPGVSSEDIKKAMEASWEVHSKNLPKEYTEQMLDFGS